MSRALLLKYVRESLLLWSALAVGLAGFAWFRVWIVSEVDTARFEQILELLPKDWRRFSPVNFEWLISYLGRTSLTLDEPMIMLMIGAWSIVRGSDVVSGELNRGTMEMVLAQPISRSRLYWQHATLTLLGLLGLVLLVWLAMAIGVWTTDITESTYPEFRVPLTQIEIPVTWFGAREQTFPMSARVSPIQFLPGIINLFFLGCFVAGYSMLVSACDRFRWRTLGIAVGIYFVAALLKVGAVASQAFRWLQWLTFFTLFEPGLSVEIADSKPTAAWYFLRYTLEESVAGLGPLGMNVLLALGAASFFVAGAIVFQRRDLPAPL